MKKATVYQLGQGLDIYLYIYKRNGGMLIKWKFKQIAIDK